MGIYIKGMEMPESCTCCDFRTFDGIIDECRVLRKFMRGWEYKNGFPTDCPLIEVKEPHGRLIDADKLFGDLKAILPWSFETEKERRLYDQIDTFKLLIEEVPTVIEGSE